ncbi:MAG TPA: hypothetical protein PLL09_04050 [Flavobacterium sp.]|uniref:hypothetical protein n=1 Tax=unclassified Flavobacterium TaxID=196869 RepID=UPI0025B9713E|nr:MULTISPECIES: hypothetical protein [unclassified Flavobacterium]HRE76979.1 hypothetical protein [Flavobacterium sp.]
MRIVDNEQIWKGFFSYLQGYEIIDSYVKVPFKMNLTFNGNSFIGTTIDSESENIFTEPIKVKGFIENDKISFIVNYPYFYFKDENGQILVDKNIKHPNIEYLGFYDEMEKKFSGTWEMIIYEEKITENEYIEEVANGEFEIYREK